MEIHRFWSINNMGNLDIFNRISSINSFSFKWPGFWWSSFWFITCWRLRPFTLIFISCKTLRISYFSRWYFISLISTIYLWWKVNILTILNSLNSSCCSCSSFCLSTWTSICNWTCLVSIIYRRTIIISIINLSWWTCSSCFRFCNFFVT